MKAKRELRREYQRDIENSAMDYDYYLRNKRRYEALEFFLIATCPYDMHRYEEYLKDIAVKKAKLKNYRNRCDIRYVNWMTTTYENVESTINERLDDLKKEVDWIRYR